MGACRRSGDGDGAVGAEGVCDDGGDVSHAPCDEGVGEAVAVGRGVCTGAGGRGDGVAAAGTGRGCDVVVALTGVEGYELGCGEQYGGVDVGEPGSAAQAQAYAVGMMGDGTGMEGAAVGGGVVNGRCGDGGRVCEPCEG